MSNESALDKRHTDAVASLQHCKDLAASESFQWFLDHLQAMRSIATNAIAIGEDSPPLTEERVTVLRARLGLLAVLVGTDPSGVHYCPRMNEWQSIFESIIKERA